MNDKTSTDVKAVIKLPKENKRSQKIYFNRVFIADGNALKSRSVCINL